MSLQYKIISKFYDLLDVIYFKDTNTNPRKGMLEYIPDRKLKVLDLCIGTAANSITIAENRPKSEIIGIDLSEDMLTVAKEKIGKRGIRNITTYVMDATNIGFDDNYFDIVVISLVLHEVDYNIRNKIIIEAKRVLKKKGRIIILEWDNPNKFIHKPLFSIIELLEPKGFKEFLHLNIKEYVEKFSLKVLREKKCDYTRIIEITKNVMDYNHLLEKYDDMTLLVTLILPEHTEAVMREIGKAMNIDIDLEEVIWAVENNDIRGINQVCLFEKGRDFVYIDCGDDLHQIIIRCLHSEREKIYDSFYKWVQLRQEAYNQPKGKELIDWMHPDDNYEKYKNPLLSNLQYNKLIDYENE